MNLKATITCLSVASLISAAAAGRSQTMERRPAHEAIGERFSHLLIRVATIADSSQKDEAIRSYVSSAARFGHALIEDTTVYFLHYGKANRVSVPGDLNGWNPAADTMTRVQGTDLFYLARGANLHIRFEYKLLVDSTWILDPVNTQQTIGGYGPNSEVWMPGYAPPPEILYRGGIPHGRIDTIAFRSRILGRSHPVFVYTPPGYSRTRERYPLLILTDGGEYLTLALMQHVLDNLIADRRMAPIVAAFIDPRTDIRDNNTSKRMTDYAMSDAFVTFLTGELRPSLLKKYRITKSPAQTGIMGASLGGLIATYAAYQHPEVFGLCAAQSPSYWWNNEAIVSLVRDGPRKRVKFYIDSGTFGDAQENTRAMRSVLEQKGYLFHYAEYPEGHNWANWRSRIGGILEFFWGTR